MLVDPHPRSLRIALILDLAVAGLLAVAVVVALHGGFEVSLAGVRISVHQPARVLALVAILVACRAVMSRRAGYGAEQLGAMVTRVGCIALLGAVFGIWLSSLVAVCGGADSYGYVSASRLLRERRLSQPEPIAAYLPVSEPVKVAAPVGYVAASDGNASVPIYPIGLPLVMAVFAAIAGDGGEFYVSPVLAALVTLLAYRIARRFTDRPGGWFSALLVAITPIFAHMAMQPMSDIAATFWIVLAVWLLVRNGERPASSIGAGIAAGMAFLTRPALVSAIGVLLLAILAIHGRRSAAVTAAAFAPFAAFQLWLHRHLYGSVLVSGYGSASHLFALDRVPGNVVSFVEWLNHSATPLLLPMLLLAGFTCRSLRLWGAAMALIAGVAAPYLFYFSYEHWHTTRFVLPGLAIAVIVCGITIANIITRWAPRAAPLLLLVIGTAAATASYRFLDREQTFASARTEARYPQVGEWIDRHAPRRAVVFAFLHSGSVRIYGGRPTVRWDQMTSSDLRASVAALEAKGWESWAVVDGPSEAAAFWPRVEGERALTVEPKDRVYGVDIVALKVANAPH